MSNTKYEDAIMKMGFRYFRDQILKMLGIDYDYWNIDVFFGFHESTFYWDCEPEQNEIYELDENNILELEQNGNTWTAEIVAVPWIRIGQTILVTDSQFYGLARIKKCVIKSKSRGKVDMYIQFIGTE